MVVWVTVGGVHVSSSQGSSPMVLVAEVVVMVGLGLAGGSYGPVAGTRSQQAWALLSARQGQETGVPPEAVVGV